VNEALHADERHDIIADRTSREKLIGKTGGTLDDLVARWPAAAVGADMDGLSGLELPMCQRPALTANGFLYVHGTGAEGAGTGFFGHGELYRPQVPQPLLQAILDRFRQRPGLREKVDPGVFFPA
jgi:hypothetical protein